MRGIFVSLLHDLRWRSHVRRAIVLRTRHTLAAFGSSMLAALVLIFAVPADGTAYAISWEPARPSLAEKTDLAPPVAQRPLKTANSAKFATILFTFDDGPSSDYLLAYPILRQYGIRGTSYLPTQYIDANTPGKLSWSQIKQMRAYGWAFGCHTYEHRHMTDMSEKDIQNSMESVNKSFQRQGLPAPDIMAYPYGSYNKRVIEAIKPYRLQARLAYYQKKFVDINDPYAINSISADMQTEHQLNVGMKIVDRACEKNATVVFRVHTLYRLKPYDTVKLNKKIRSGCAPQTDSRLFAALVKYCVDKGCTFLTMEELQKRMSGSTSLL